jgi:hypothetical protein
MHTWAPLWSGIVESSVWEEPDDVRIVFITMLAIKDSDHVVRMSAFSLGRKANKTEKEVLAALKVLMSPDKRRIEKQPFDGRRVEKVPDGWLVLNGESYRRKVSEEMRKARLRRAQSVYREKQARNAKKTVGRGNAKGMEAAALAADAAGDTAAFDEAVTESLPPGLQ